MLNITDNFLFLLNFFSSWGKMKNLLHHHLMYKFVFLCSLKQGKLKSNPENVILPDKSL